MIQASWTDVDGVGRTQDFETASEVWDWLCEFVRIFRIRLDATVRDSTGQVVGGVGWVPEEFRGEKPWPRRGYWLDVEAK
jgi:hypothetical protein